MTNGKSSYVLVAAAAATAMALFACSSGDDAPAQGASANDEGSPSESETDPGLEANDSGAASDAADGVPCDVAKVLKDRCISCHDSLARAPMLMLSYADLVAPAPTQPSRKVAEVAVIRMTDDAEPMPPVGPRATADEIDALRAWNEAGLPHGTCQISR